MSESILTNRNGLRAQSLINAKITLAQDNYSYTGTSVRPEIESVMLGETQLIENKDFYIINGSATNKGEYMLGIVGIGRYDGVAYVSWKITKNAASIQVDKEALTIKGIMGTTSEINAVITGDGEVTGRIEDETYASVEKVGNKFTVTSKKAGQTNLIIEVAEGEQYGSARKAVPISVEKADGSISLSESSVIIEGVMGTRTSVDVIVPEVGRIGTITANVGYDDPIVSVLMGENTSSLSSGSSGKTSYYLLLTSVGAGSKDITVTCSESEDYTEASTMLHVEVKKATRTLTVTPSSLTISGAVGTQANVNLEYEGTSDISLASEPTHVSYVVGEDKKSITFTSVSTGNEEITINLAKDENYYGASATLSIEVVLGHIYGVRWDGSASPQLERTDDAKDFGDPSPAISNGTGSSPFDKLEPWCNIKKVTKDGNTLVAIPKFWYKITDNGETGITIQIADYAAKNFHVSPTHMDRNDGVGERDWMYVGRYHCASDYKSKTGVLPETGRTRSNFRTNITGLGDGYYMWDYAMWKTIQMLYLVEFAHWNSQLKIGFGCGNGSSTENMGSTDTMTYHTGTKSSSRETYAVGTQYRYIEGLWDNVIDWLDGITYSDYNVYVGIEPSKYNDSTTNYTNVGLSKSGGCIQAWGIPSQSDYEWAIYPSAVVSDSSYSTYNCDNFGSSLPCCRVGGSYSKGRSYGLFYSTCASTTNPNSNVGARIQYFPKAGEILS